MKHWTVRPLVLLPVSWEDHVVNIVLTFDHTVPCIIRQISSILKLCQVAMKASISVSGESR